MYRLLFQFNEVLDKDDEERFHFIINDKQDNKETVKVLHCTDIMFVEDD